MLSATQKNKLLPPPTLLLLSRNCSGLMTPWVTAQWILPSCHWGAEAIYQKNTEVLVVLSCSQCSRTGRRKEMRCPLGRTVLVPLSFLKEQQGRKWNISPLASSKSSSHQLLLVLSCAERLMLSQSLCCSIVTQQNLFHMGEWESTRLKSPGFLSHFSERKTKTTGNIC